MTREQIVIPWGRQPRDAGHYLAAASILGEHFFFQDTVTLRHETDGPDLIDLDQFESFNWSSGERTLVNLFLTFAGWPRHVTLDDVLNLDTPNRNAAGNAISMLCALPDRWDIRTQSYVEAF